MTSSPLGRSTRTLFGHASGAPYPVHQYGPRRLWDEVKNAHDWWIQQDKPDAGHWQFTVTPRGQRIELVDL